MRSLSFGALARVAANHGKSSAIVDHVCKNRGQGGFEPKQYHIDRRRQFRRLLCADFKDFKWGLIAASAGDDDLFITAPVLQLCIHVQKAWRAARARDEDSALSQSYVWGGLRRIIEIQKPDDWVAPSHPFFFSFVLRKNIPTVTPLASEGEPFSSWNLKQGSALFRNSQVTIQVFPLAKEKR